MSETAILKLFISETATKNILPVEQKHLRPISVTAMLNLSISGAATLKLSLSGAAKLKLSV